MASLVGVTQVVVAVLVSWRCSDIIWVPDKVGAFEGLEESSCGATTASSEEDKEGVMGRFACSIMVLFQEMTDDGTMYYLCSFNCMVVLGRN